MKKITPVMLVLLLVASLMANIDVTNLETTEEIEETGARNGADAEIVAITSPKETQCNPTCRNELLVGQDTTFEVYLQNSGDQALTELGYSVTIYLADQQGGPSDIVAKNSLGDELVWENTLAICDFGCDETSLAAGDVYKNGKTVLQYQGNDIVWTPSAGEYVVYIETISDQDVDRENDFQFTYVKVVDYIDIEVDIQWTGVDAQGNDVNPDFATGGDDKDFTVTVTMNGSTDFVTNNLSIVVNVGGDLDNAVGEDGADLRTESSAGGHTVQIGTQQNVIVKQNATDPTDNETGNRIVFANDINGGEWTYNGTVSPDTSGNGEATYYVDVSLGSFFLYDLFESCVETVIVNGTDEEGNTVEEEQSFQYYCEEEQQRDGITRNNIDEITGSTTTFHDIRISGLTVFQGFEEDGGGQPSSVVTSDSPNDLVVGASWVHAVVEHRGSEEAELYDWNVTFVVTNLDTGVAETITDSKECTAIEPIYTYMPLGFDMNAQMEGTACALFDIGVGNYQIDATLNMDSTKNTDQKLSNNVATITKKSINNLPLISSLDLITQGDLYLGMQGLVELEAFVFDADDVNGIHLNYSWTAGADNLPLECGGIGEFAHTCSFEIIPDYVTNFPVVLTVTDEYGGTTSDKIDLEIWNSISADSTSTSGVMLEYDIIYWSPSDFTVSIADVDASTCEGIELQNDGVKLRGTYTPVALMDFSASQYDASSVLQQSITLTFDNTLGVQSLWYSSSCENMQLTQLLSETVEVDAEDSTKSTITAVLDGASLRSGQLLLIADELVEEQPPVAVINGFSASAGKGGSILMNWGLTNTPLQGDKISVSVTHEDGTVFEVDLETSVATYTYSGSSTTHGESYDIEVAVCNTEGLCSSPIGSATVVADKEVEGATATSVQVTEADDKWTLTWSTTSDELDDVASWNVCYKNREAFDAANMPTTCVNTGSADTLTADVMMSTAPGQYTVYFAVVPVDELGNTGTAGSSSDAGADAAFYKANEGGEITDDNTDGDDTSSGELPGWTWGAIGGVVVIAFIAGAFILSRGGGDGDDKDWDY